MSWIPAPFMPHIPLEPTLKTLFSIVGLIVEGFFNYSKEQSVHGYVYRLRNAEGKLNDLSKFNHIIIYFGFALSGIVDLYSLCFRIPSPTSTIFLSLSFFVEGLLFYYHTIGRTLYNAMVHRLLIFCIISCFIFTLMRLYSPVNIIIKLELGSSLLLQGTWLMQTGHFLFGNYLKKDEEVTNEHVMMATACFAWHMYILSVGLQVGPFQCPASEAHNVAQETSLYRRSSWTWKGLLRCHQSYYS